MLVKIFTATNEETEKLEDTIDDWLCDNVDIDIRHITQSESPNAITICIWFNYQKEEE